MHSHNPKFAIIILHTSWLPKLQNMYPNHCHYLAMPMSPCQPKKKPFHTRHNLVTPISCPKSVKKSSMDSSKIWKEGRDIMEALGIQNVSKHEHVNECFVEKKTSTWLLKNSTTTLWRSNDIEYGWNES
jgi:hypothetical protein